MGSAAFSAEKEIVLFENNVVKKEPAKQKQKVELVNEIQKMLDHAVIYQIVMLSRPETNENSFRRLKGM